ncbi:MAG: hypothetical protein K9K67_07175 [Bacteriovoracaceae bacterium]|nr:hypothetical protein [Bacteriovoracaceae bacterium]
MIAKTGHKDLKLADHYSKSNEDDQRHFSEKIMAHIRSQNTGHSRTDFDEKGERLHQGNVISLFGDKFGTTD